MDNVQGNYRIAYVKFLKGKNDAENGYVFALYDDTVEVGDMVVCDTKYGFALAEVLNIVTADVDVKIAVTREVVCKVDTSAYTERKRKAERAQAVRSRMDAIAASFRELQMFRMIAEQNEEMAALLEEYNGLVN